MSKTILIIDDEADVRAFLAAVLKKAGYQIEMAENGHHGLEMARKIRPDLVTLDLMMPNQSGTDFYRKLARDKELKQTPVIVVSGLPGRHLAVSRPEAVFDKPIDPDEFIATVRRVLGDED